MSRKIGEKHIHGSGKYRGQRKFLKEEKRKEAEERNAAWQTLSPEQQLESLDKRHMTATRQRARIEKKRNV